MAVDAQCRLQGFGRARIASDQSPHDPQVSEGSALLPQSEHYRPGVQADVSTTSGMMVRLLIALVCDPPLSLEFVLWELDMTGSKPRGLRVAVANKRSVAWTMVDRRLTAPGSSRLEKLIVSS